MIVVDTDVVAYLYLPTEFTAQAEALFERDPEWVVPLLWRSEFRNILAGYRRRAKLGFDEACTLQAEAESLLAGNEFEVGRGACSSWFATVTARRTTASSWRSPSAMESSS